MLAILAGKVTGAEIARRYQVTEVTVSHWKAKFLDAGARSLTDRPHGPAGKAGSDEERRMRAENEQLKLALAEATVQLRIWKHGAKYVDKIPSPTSKP